jgi:hypothetical protein
MSDYRPEQRLAFLLGDHAEYYKAKILGLLEPRRWEEGIPHHPMSKRLMSFLKDYDSTDCGDHFCWKTGGDGDNGECLMYEMDVFFEMLDGRNRKVLVPVVGKTYLFTDDTWRRVVYQGIDESGQHCWLILEDIRDSRNVGSVDHWLPEYVQEDV